MNDTPNTAAFVKHVAENFHEDLGPGSDMLNFVLDSDVDDRYLAAFDEFSKSPDFGRYLVMSFEGFSYGGNLFEDTKEMYRQTEENNPVRILAEAFAQYISTLGLIYLSREGKIAMKETA